MRRHASILTAVALLLAGCAGSAPKPPAPVTATQAAQYNVLAAPATPLQKIAQSEEHFMEFPVWLWNSVIMDAGAVRVRAGEIDVAYADNRPVIATGTTK